MPIYFNIAGKSRLYINDNNTGKDHKWKHNS